MKKKSRKTSKSKIRFLLAFVVFGTITAILGYNLFSNVLSIKRMNDSKKELLAKINELASEKETLEADILKLNDSDYIAKYVREKYFYSKKDEIILRIDD
jgi:cell division protein DivIC